MNIGIVVLIVLSVVILGQLVLLRSELRRQHRELVRRLDRRDDESNGAPDSSA